MSAAESIVKGTLVSITGRPNGHRPCKIFTAARTDSDSLPMGDCCLHISPLSAHELDSTALEQIVRIHKQHLSTGEVECEEGKRNFMALDSKFRSRCGIQVRLRPAPGAALKEAAAVEDVASEFARATTVDTTARTLQRALKTRLDGDWSLQHSGREIRFQSRHLCDAITPPALDAKDVEVVAVLRSCTVHSRKRALEERKDKVERKFACTSVQGTAEKGNAARAAARLKQKIADETGRA